MQHTGMNIFSHVLCVFEQYYFFSYTTLYLNARLVWLSCMLHLLLCGIINCAFSALSSRFWSLTLFE